MIDSVIAGTGNSRYLRTSISASTTWEDALTMLRAGTFPIDLAGINLDGFATLGTALNADTLLKSAIITALGLEADATPSDAWEAVLALIDTKADADSVVTGLSYDGATKTLSATINGASVTVATFNFTTPQEAAEVAPVQSVAGKTGIVALNAGDVAYSEGTSYSANTIGKALEDDDARMGEIEGDITEIQGDISDIQGDITEIQGDISDIQGDITEIQGDISDIQGDISDINGSITGINNELDAFESDVEENYARVDGYYEEMTVGNAEQLVATVGIDDNAPYLFRTTGGSADVGDRKTMELVGGTVAWHQMIKEFSSDNWAEESGCTATYADGEVVASSSTNSSGIFARKTYPSPPAGHKYLLTVDLKSETQYSSFIVGFRSATGVQQTYITIPGDNTFHTYAYVKNSIATSTPTTSAYIYRYQGTFENVHAKNFMLINLTQMFGSAIADYIYSLEQAHAGDGIAWFKKLFPNPYYAYDAGTLMSVKTSANVTTGFNQFDKSKAVADSRFNASGTTGASGTTRSDYILCVPGATYYFKNVHASGVMAAVFWFDSNKEYISHNFIQGTTSPVSGTETAPNNAYYMGVNMPNASVNDCCINLSWDGERDGEYEAYEEHTYPLDPDLELRGIPKLTADNQLYYDGDTYEADGTVTRRYGVLTINGTENWGSLGTNNRFRLVATDYPQIAMSNTDVLLVANAYYDSVNKNTMASTDKTICTDVDNNGAIVIRDTDYSDATAFKAYLAALNSAGTPLVVLYTLKTPTTETADPFADFMVIDDFGTEEFVDAGVTADPPTRDVAIPVGHNTVYAANLRAKLEMAPDSPDGDGDYIVRQTNGENAYVLLEKELPAAPTENGTYILKVVINNGTATYSWEAQT